MYIAMNRFKVVRGAEDEFETVWSKRDRRLNEVPGFMQFKLLRGPEEEDHTLFASHTIWESYNHFVAWTKSPALAVKSMGSRAPTVIRGS